MKINPPPDPNEFARKMLFYICGLESQLIIMMQMMARQCEPDIDKANQLFLVWSEAALVQHKKLYEEALKEIGIPPREQHDSESSED